MKIVVRRIPPSLNAILGMHWGEREKEKEIWKELVFQEVLIRGLQMIEGKVKVKLVYYFRDKKIRDYDNYPGKFILDGLKNRVIKDDSSEIIKELSYKFEYDPGDPRVEILIEEVRNEDNN